MPSFGSAERLDELTGGTLGTWTTSGRAALASLLKHLRRIGVVHVHLPAYLCESILQPVRVLGFDYSFYPVDGSLTAYPDPPPGSAVVIIHYFGWINSATGALRAQAGESFYLIEDASQALLSDWSTLPEVSRYVFLSPRKFGPAPLGGWCNLCLELDKPSDEVEALAWRSLAARLVRGAYLAEPDRPIDASVERFYLTSLRAVETFLDTHATAAPVPRIALDIIAGQDWRDTATRRRANWQQLTELLRDHVEMITSDLPASVVPLGCAIRLRHRDRVRSKLAAQRIFCPVHWPLPVEVSRGRFPDAVLLSDTLLTLPIDQRYGPDEMDQMADALLNAL